LPWLFWRWGSCKLSWLWTWILPISASQVARITGVSLWCLISTFHYSSSFLPPS
jgi:hypothetical protein